MDECGGLASLGMEDMSLLDAIQEERDKKGERECVSGRWALMTKMPGRKEREN